MIRIQFFARLRQQVGYHELVIENLGTSLVVTELIAELERRYGPTLAGFLRAPQVLCAVNHTKADPSTIIVDGDEVAFYPPVTGG